MGITDCVTCHRPAWLPPEDIRSDEFHLGIQFGDETDDRTQGYWDVWVDGMEVAAYVVEVHVGRTGHGWVIRFAAEEDRDNAFWDHCMRYDHVPTELLIGQIQVRWNPPREELCQG